MGTEVFLGSLPIIGAIGFVVFIALGVAVLMETKRGGSMSDAVRRLYIYLVSFLTLLIVSVSFMSLLELGLRTYVFTKADPISTFQSPPPTPYLLTEDVNGKVQDPVTKLTCEGSCTLTESQKTSIEQWTSEYKNWKNQNEPKQQRAQMLITVLSFMIIAGIVFVVHWFFALRDARTSGESFTRSTYLWAMSFVWLITSVVTLGFLLTTTLKGAFNVNSSSFSLATPAAVIATDTATVQSLQTCGTACGLSDETIALAGDWKSDYDAWNKRNSEEQQTRDRHNALANQLAMALIALPLFGYHFMAAWKENKKAPPAPNAKLV